MDWNPREENRGCKSLSTVSKTIAAYPEKLLELVAYVPPPAKRTESQRRCYGHRVGISSVLTKNLTANLFKENNGARKSKYLEF